MTDGTRLRNSGVTTTSGVSMNMTIAKGTVGKWSQIQSNIGQWLNGKTIDKILFGYDYYQPESGGPAVRPTGQYRGYIDDIIIMD
jgi:hypothetical protein